MLRLCLTLLGVHNLVHELKQFFGLLVFGNIENLILAAQGVSASVDPFILLGLSLAAVTCWFLIGTLGTRMAIKYARHINFIGGLAIFILGIEAMLESLPQILAFLH